MDWNLQRKTDQNKNNSNNNNDNLNAYREFMHTGPEKRTATKKIIS
ncbi:MAG: hypothetical protein ACM3XP_01125 [Nitrososphaerales archaeon]